jgi:prepilin-type N-terminal cleavage/methylation domain-containing protein
MNPRAPGFTLIELVLVIAILSAIAVLALPRFSDLSTQAHRSSVAATAASFADAVIVVRAGVIARGLSGPNVDNVPNFGDGTVDVNVQGFPVGTGGANTITGVASCTQLWSALFQNPPTITTGAGTNFDYRATRAGQVCTYTYLRQISPARRFTYTATTGVVAVTNP